MVYGYRTKRRSRRSRRRRASGSMAAWLIGLAFSRRPGLLYQAARKSQTIAVWSSGSAHRIIRRHRNKIVGRFAFKSGLLGRFWR